MTYEALTHIALQPGQAWRVAADARTSIQVLRGRVVLREVCAGEAGSAIATAIPLAEGQVHRLVQTGWIELAACGDVELLTYREPGWLARVAKACRLWTGTLARSVAT